MKSDPIVDELDRLRAEQMARFNFDFDSFYRELKEQEKLLPQAVQPQPASPSAADTEGPGHKGRAGGGVQPYSARAARAQ